MNDQNVLFVLIRLGLTRNQAKVYLTLYRSAPSTAKAISKNSGVARSDVYRVMATLEKLGLIERLIAAPYKFRAISMDNAFNVLINRKMSETSELKLKAKEILSKFKNENERKTPEEDEIEFSLLLEKAAVLRMKKKLENIKKSFDTIISWKDPYSVIFVGIDELADILQKGVKIRIIMDKVGEKKVLSDIIKEFQKSPTFKIRYVLNASEPFMSIFDKEEVWLGTSKVARLKEMSTLRTRNRCLIEILQEHFESLWLKAKEC